MDFAHSEERRMLQDTLGRYFENEYSIARRGAAATSEPGFDAEVWSQLAELGVFAALFSEEQGGFGGTGFDIAVVFEAVGRALMTGPLIDSVLLAGGAVAASENTQHAEYLEKILDGRARAAFAHYESQGRHNLSFVQTKAVQNGENWILSGQKHMVRNCLGADHIVVSARISGTANDSDGLALFLLPSGAPGVEISDFATVDGAKAANLKLSDVDLPGSALVCGQSSTAKVLETVVGRATLAVCAEALGIMDSIKTLTIEYLRTRKQFGVAIGAFQALQHRMAEILLEIEQAKSAVINAAAALDSARIEREQSLSAAKYTIARVGALVAEEAIQMHGGIGMTWEYDLGHFAKRLILIDHEFGDEDYHLQRFIDFGRLAES